MYSGSYPPSSVPEDNSCSTLLLYFFSLFLCWIFPTHMKYSVIILNTLFLNRTPPFSYCPFKKKFYWGIVALQCCVSFCTAKWIRYTYACIPSSLDFLPTRVITDQWIQFPVLYSRFSLVTNLMQRLNSVYMSITISQFIPFLPFPLGIYMFALYICISIFCFVDKIIYPNFFRFYIYAWI